METKAVARYIRIAPRKARAVVDLIRGKSIEEASLLLKYNQRVAAKTVAKVLDAAVANAAHNNRIRDGLYVSRVFVDQGPTLKRFRPRAMGRASRIHKRTSHITIYVDQREEALQSGTKS